MKKFKLILLNLRYTNKKILVYFLFISILYGFYGASFVLNNCKQVKFSIGDIFIFLFGGIQYKKNSLVDYTTWFGFIVLIYYPIINFLFKQFSDKKLFVFYRIKKYKEWYYSNLIIAILYVVIFFILLYGTVFLISLKVLGLSEIVNINIFNELKQAINFKYVFVQLISLNILFIVSIILMSLNLFFITKKFNVSVLIILVSTYLSSFFNNSFSGKVFLGNVAMLVRNESFKNGNVNINIKYSIEFFVAIIIVNLILGHFLYRRNIEM